ncbi:hypothetical protein [Metallosphaera sedula]|uniref:hypothetical protein n=1 Tax=Metallosphaera sedula TaxID=43687 RepID=UPI0020C07EA6|nr:hypothetical protein [Metallosphaera sedula]
MTEVLQDHLRKAYELLGRASKLVSVDRAARRILSELNELINSLEEFRYQGLEYDEAEVGTKLKMYEKQLRMIEEKRDSTLLMSYREMARRQMSKPGSLQGKEVGKK